MPIPEPGARPLAVLLVDDDENTREVYAEYCRCVGVLARTAADGDEALASVRADRPDVIVLDYAMPGKNGIDVLNLLRDDRALAAIPVIILSGRDRDLQSVHGAPWLRKPLDPSELLEHIRQVLVHSEVSPRV